MAVFVLPDFSCPIMGFLCCNSLPPTAGGDGVFYLVYYPNSVYPEYYPEIPEYPENPNPDYPYPEYPPFFMRR